MSTKQIVVLKEITVVAVIKPVGSKIPDGRQVSAVYGVVAKQLADGDEPNDTDRTTSNQNLRDFLEIT